MYITPLFPEDSSERPFENDFWYKNMPLLLKSDVMARGENDIYWNFYGLGPSARKRNFWAFTQSDNSSIIRVGIPRSTWDFPPKIDSEILSLKFFCMWVQLCGRPRQRAASLSTRPPPSCSARGRTQCGRSRVSSRASGLWWRCNPGTDAAHWRAAFPG